MAGEQEGGRHDTRTGKRCKRATGKEKTNRQERQSDRRTIEGAYLRRKILKNKSNIYVFPQTDGKKTIIVNNEGRKRDKTSKNIF